MSMVSARASIRQSKVAFSRRDGTDVLLLDVTPLTLAIDTAGVSLLR